MLRLALSPAPIARPLLRRSLASTVLLTRSWHNETVATLRQEAISRGLSSKGTRTTLAQRLREYEDRKLFDTTSTQVTGPKVNQRLASTVASERDTGISPQSQPGTASLPQELLLNIQLPDISDPQVELPVQIPYVPDFWNSSSSNEVISTLEEEPLPKLLVVAGADTHHGGGPSHNLLVASEPFQQAQFVGSSSSHPVALAEGTGGLLYDIVEDIGLLNALPVPKSARKSVWQLFS